MMTVKEDLTGKYFGKWVVLYQVEDYISPTGKYLAMWRCRCSCNKHTERDILTSSLKQQKTTSCGCERGKGFKKYNKYDLTGECGVGWASNTNKEFYFDLEDYDLIKDYCWREEVNIATGYTSLVSHIPGSGKFGGSIVFHQVLGYKSPDHIDRNPLNNRRDNLRVATRSQNAMNKEPQSNNTSGVIGVCYRSTTNKWRAYIKINQKQRELGEFNSKDEAIKTRLIAEKELFKEFAPQKHLYEQYGIK